MRETGIFTGTTDSQCPSLRQRPNRYAIRAGRNLPDKEFRYLRTVLPCYSPMGARARSFLPRSARCRAGRTVSSHHWVWRTVSEDSRTERFEPFLLIVRPPRILTATFFGRGRPSGEYRASSGVPSIQPDF